MMKPFIIMAKAGDCAAGRVTMRKRSICYRCKARPTGNAGTMKRHSTSSGSAYKWLKFHSPSDLVTGQYLMLAELFVQIEDYTGPLKNISG
jgi:hypothetical protein